MLDGRGWFWTIQRPIRFATFWTNWSKHRTSFFFLLTIAGEIYYRLLAAPPATPSIMEYLHFMLFYSHPLWIISRNFFHCDGPLIWFPLNWSYHFVSPISYWESAYGGRAFATLEVVLNVVLLGYLLAAHWPVVWRRWMRKP